MHLPSYLKFLLNLLQFLGKLPCHIRQCHVGKPMFQCPVCDFTSTYSKNNVKSHMVSLHGMAVFIFVFSIKYSNLILGGPNQFYGRICWSSWWFYEKMFSECSGYLNIFRLIFYLNKTIFRPWPSSSWAFWQCK